MHELSIAMSIVDGAADEAARYHNRRVGAVRLRLGRLSGVVKEALLFSYGLACEGTALEGSRLEIEDVSAVIFCGKCNAEKTLVTIQDFSCPVCHTPSAEVVQGREILITGLELTDEYAAAAG